MAFDSDADSITLVSRDDLEAQLAAVREKIADPAAGIFGPDSISWRINRESALFLGAGRAALLQLAHPWVAAALDQHSSLLENPIARFHNTFRVVFTMIFGSSAQAFAAALSLHELHTHIRGEVTETVAAFAQGSSYAANHIPALCWVFATLVDSAVLAYECVSPRLTDAERHRYYSEAKTLASLFGIPAEALPPDWNSFQTYIGDTSRSQALGVSDRARYIGLRLLAGSGSWIHIPAWYRALTAEWMPPRLRAEFGLKFGMAELASAQRAQRWLPHVYPLLPPAIRFVGPYHEAKARLRQRPPSYLTRSSNRFWIGEKRLPFNDKSNAA
jgi:uncharacterized protein (DUF2236 family)